MRRFRDGQRVVVTRRGTPLTGKVGTVKRVRMSDACAWVEMDERPPEGLCPFPVGDMRANHAMLDPGDCEPVATPPGAA